MMINTPFRPWTPGECELAAELLKPYGLKFVRNARGRFIVTTKGQLMIACEAIGKRIGRNTNGVANKLCQHGPTFCEPRLDDYTRHRRGQVFSRASGRRSPDEYKIPTKIPERVLREQDYRLNLEPRDLTAAFCGDPLPGYSALDRQSGVIPFARQR